MSISTASKLDALVGLQGAKRLVRKLSQGASGLHAVLFYGVPGSGKHALADLLAEAWLCQSPGEDGADGTCKACASFGRGNNSDFLRVTPQGPSRMIRTAQIRPTDPREDDFLPVTEFFRTMPLASRHRVVLIEDAHRMNSAAANALLKTLEEPQSHGKLILTTDSVGSVPATILSRCLAVPCELPSREALRELAPKASDEVIRMSDGAPGRVVTASEKPELYDSLASFARSLRVSQPGAALVVAERFREISDAIGAAAGLNARAANAQALELLATFLSREAGAPPSWTQEIVKAHRVILGNGNPQLIFDALFSTMLVEGK